MGIRIALVDDHPLFRSALAQVIRTGAAEGEIEIVEAGRLDEMLARLEAGLEVDLLTLDLGLPGLQGLLGLMSVRNLHPTVPVVVVSARGEPSIVARCLMIGAAAFIPKSSSREEIREALRVVLAGGKWTPGGCDPDYVGSAKQRATLESLCSLSPRELQVCLAIGRGQLNREIAQAFAISEATVKAHVSRILEKLGATSRTHAAVLLSQLDGEAVDARPPLLRAS